MTLFNNEGNALIMTVIVTFVLFIFAGSLLYMSTFANNLNINVYDREQALIIARSTVLSLKEYIIYEGDKSFSTLGVPINGGASNISESMVYINLFDENLGEANNIRVNVVDKNSSTWEVTVAATGYYPDISYITSGVDATVTFEIPKSTDNSVGGEIDNFTSNAINSLGGDIEMIGNTIVAGGIYAGGNIKVNGSAYFPRAQENSVNYIKAGGRIDITGGGYRFDIDGIEAVSGIEIGGSSQAHWPARLQNQQMGIPLPSTNSFNNTTFKTAGNFIATIWNEPFFADNNSTLLHLQESIITTQPADLPLTRKEVNDINDLNLIVEPAKVIMNQLPTGEGFLDHDINSGKDITSDVRLTGTLSNFSTLIIDATHNDIVIYVDSVVTMLEGSNIIIHDGRDTAAENSNSVVFIIAPGGELIFNGTGIRLNDTTNKEIPQLFFISNSFDNILTINTTSIVKGYVIAPNASVNLFGVQTMNSEPNFHGSVIANKVNMGGGGLFVMKGEPIQSTMEKVVSRYVSEVRGGGND